LSRRVRGYKPELLDQLCHAGQVGWLRLTPGPRDDADAPVGQPSKATPISVVFRSDTPWLLEAAGAGVDPPEPTVGATAEIIEALRTRGASFAGELGPVTGRLPQDVERALWDRMARGLITCDGFGAIRARVAPERPPTRNPALRPVRMSRLGRLSRATNAAAGRWSLVPPADEGIDQHELAEVVAEQLLNRWGVVFRDLAIRDDLRLPWRHIQWALRRLEDRGLVRGGRFVAGFNGEQYALPTAIEQLDHVRKLPRTGERVLVNATDPLNLVGVIVPGATVASVRTNHVVFVDGVPEDSPAKAAPGPARGTDRGTGGDLAGSGPPTPDRVAARVVWAGSP
jgi:ATP-dependent Lhr-like helicase